MKIPGFLDHMPDDWIENPKHRERGFFYGICGCLAPDWLEALVANCRVKRKREEPEDIPVRPLPIDRKWADELLKLPFISSKYIL